MSDNSLKSKLVRYMDAGFPVIYINAFEEDKVDAIIRSVSAGREIYEWNGMMGYVDFETGAPMIEDCSLETMLDQMKMPEMLDRKIVILKDAASYLEDSKIVAKIKGLVRLINQGTDATIIIVSNILVIPKELERYITILEMDYPDVEEIRKVITDFIQEYQIRNVKDDLIGELSVAFKGLTEFEIRNLLALSYTDDGEIARSDLDVIYDQKQQIIKKAGILEMIPLKESMDDIGGLENLKTWFKKKSMIFKHLDDAKKFGVDMPKGVLIAGIPGCGKSLNAKAAAKLFNVPLLRMDMGRLMGKYVGESEENMRKAISLAEAISPCILWIDELEKAFSGVGGEGGGADVVTRMFGYFLTWMQEKDSPVFVVATANDIKELPAELLRKGRFDEIFYVGLPNKEERQKIFEIHIRKRRVEDLKNINTAELAAMTDGFSGADIEGVVKDAVENAYTSGRAHVLTSDIENAIKNTNPLSIVMKDDLKKLQDEYAARKFKNASK